MKKFLLLLAILLVAIISILVVYNLINNRNTNTDIVKSYVHLEDLMQHEIEFDSEILYLFEPGDKEAMFKYIENLIIAEISSIENQYWDDKLNGTVTIGTLKVKKVFKGNLTKGEEISFIRDGGIISLSEFENSLDKRSRHILENLNTAERIKFYGLDKFTKEEKDTQYVFDSSKGNIPVENKKTYLMYLNYDDNLKKYRIKYSFYGLREVDTSSAIFNYENAKVKNNENGNYVNIESVLPSELIKENWFTKLYKTIIMYFIGNVYS